MFGIAATVSSTDVIAEDRLTWARESLAGVSPWAYYWCKDIRLFIDVIILSLAWVAPWFFLTLPNIDFGQAWVIFGLVAWMQTGVCYFLTTLLSKKWALMVGVMFPCLMAVLYAGLDPTYPLMSWPQRVLSYFSFGRYAYPLYIVMDLRRLPEGFTELLSIKALSEWYGWPITWGTIAWTVGGLIGMGVLFRLAACIIIMVDKILELKTFWYRVFGFKSGFESPILRISYFNQCHCFNNIVN